MADQLRCMHRKPPNEYQGRVVEDLVAYYTRCLHYSPFRESTGSF